MSNPGPANRPIPEHVAARRRESAFFAWEETWMDAERCKRDVQTKTDRLVSKSKQTDVVIPTLGSLYLLSNILDDRINFGGPGD